VTVIFPAQVRVGAGWGGHDTMPYAAARASQNCAFSVCNKKLIPAII